MRVKKNIFYGLTLSLLVSASVFAATPAEELKERVKKMYPNTVFTSVSPTKMEGVFEVVMGKNIGYTNIKGEEFIFGHLFDMQTGTDLTAKELSKLNSVAFGKLPLEQALKKVKGDGSRKLVVFTDVDCPYCARLEKDTLSRIDNVTIYTFLMPLEQLHPSAREKSIAVWCDKNPVQAFDDLMSIKKNPATASANCKHPIDANIALGKSMQISGTPTLIREDGTRQAGAMGPGELDEWLNSNGKAK